MRYERVIFVHHIACHASGFARMRGPNAGTKLYASALVAMRAV
jgi:hypothetical protein